MTSTVPAPTAAAIAAAPIPPIKARAARIAKIRTQWIAGVQLKLVDSGLPDEVALDFARKSWRANYNVIIPELAGEILFNRMMAVATEQFPKVVR